MAPGAAQALTILAVSCERLGLLAAAHDALTRLATSDVFKAVKASLKDFDPKASADPVSLHDWAAKRLEGTALRAQPQPRHLLDRHGQHQQRSALVSPPTPKVRCR